MGRITLFLLFLYLISGVLSADDVVIVETPSTTMFNNLGGISAPELFALPPEIFFASSFVIFKIDAEDNEFIRRIKIDTCKSEFDTVLAVFTHFPAIGDFKLVGLNDDRIPLSDRACPSFTSFIDEMLVYPKQEVYILVGGYFESEPYSLSVGNGVLEVKFRGYFPISAFDSLFINVKDAIYQLRVDVVDKIQNTTDSLLNLNQISKDELLQRIDEWKDLNVPTQEAQNIQITATDLQSKLNDNEIQLSSLNITVSELSNHLDTINDNLDPLLDIINNIDIGAKNLLVLNNLSQVNQSFSQFIVWADSFQSQMPNFLPNIDIASLNSSFGFPTLQSKIIEIFNQLNATAMKTDQIYQQLVLTTSDVGITEDTLDLMDESIQDSFSLLYTKINSLISTLSRISVSLLNSSQVKTSLQFNNLNVDIFELNVRTEINRSKNEIVQTRSSVSNLSSLSAIIFQRLINHLNNMNSKVRNVRSQSEIIQSSLESFEYDMGEQLFINDIHEFLPNSDPDVMPPVTLRIPNSFGGRMDDVARYIQQLSVIINSENDGDEYYSFSQRTQARIDQYNEFVESNSFRKAYRTLQFAYIELFPDFTCDDCDDHSFSSASSLSFSFIPIIVLYILFL